MDAWLLLQEWKEELPAGEKKTIRARLAQHLNDLLLHDFAALVQVLYRVDVPEANVKTVLQQNPGTDAGELLADLLLQRMKEKEAVRKKFPTPPPQADEERW